MMDVIVSVNVGLPQDVAWQGRTVRTAVWKQPVAGWIFAGRLNLDGDGQADLRAHGGEQRALLVYQLESYRYWASYFGRSDLVPGNFGENLTVEGLADAEVCIGDRFRLGGAIVEVSQPRDTCYRVGIRLENPEMPALLVAHRRPGFYFRVIQEGEIGAGDHFEKLSDGPEHMSPRSMPCSTRRNTRSKRYAARYEFRRSAWTGKARCRCCSPLPKREAQPATQALGPARRRRLRGVASARLWSLPRARKARTSDRSSSPPKMVRRCHRHCRASTSWSA
jgi:MOSC domain-containing protein YiiM